MRRSPRHEHRRAGACLHLVVTHAEPERALEHVPGLVVRVVNVQARDRPLAAGEAARIGAFDQHELPFPAAHGSRGERVGARRHQLGA
jgi:hypothetical protein